jgi:hypothetical protein
VAVSYCSDFAGVLYLFLLGIAAAAGIIDVANAILVLAVATFFLFSGLGLCCGVHLYCAWRPR